MRAPTRPALLALAITCASIAVTTAAPAHAAPNDGHGPRAYAGPVVKCPRAVPITYGDLTKRDRDGDRIPDVWEMTWGLDHTNPCDALVDEDNDDLTNLAEYRHSTIPYIADSDNDGLKDGLEVKGTHTNPNRGDTDRDGLSDRAEVKRYATNPHEADSDADGLRDPDEIKRGTDPRNPDTDRDNITDGHEVTLDTDPRNPDTDGDGVDDYTEAFVNYTNPTVAETPTAA